MTRKDFIRRYVLVHKCCGCDDILDFEHSAGAFCDKCSVDWNASLTASCENCFKIASECECMPKELSGAGALCLRRLFFYKSEESREPAMRIIYWLKYKKSRRVTDFVASELCDAIKEEISTLGYPADKQSFVVCGVPRSKRSLIKHGYDQSANVAKSVSRLLDIPFAEPLASKGKRLQKDLGKKQRRENAKASIKLRKDADVKDKYVVLFDDMVTTGASMAACVGLLRRAGARGVLCFSLASSAKM